MASTIVTFELGDREVEVMVAPMTTLQSVLRDQLGATATKEGCRQGGCGSCTVLVDGEPMLSCLLPVEDVAGRRVTTLESHHPGRGPRTRSSRRSSTTTPSSAATAPRAWSWSRRPCSTTTRRPTTDDISRGARRQHLPLHRLPAHRPGDRGRRRSHGTAATERRPDEHGHSTSSAGRSTGATASAT